MTSNPPISRQILEDEQDIIHYVDSGQQLGTFGFRGLDIALFTNESHQYTLLAVIKGLGHELHIVYSYDELGGASGPFIADVRMFYEDFCDFVLYEREETRATIN